MNEPVKAPSRVMVRVEEHEGSLLYTDANGRDGVRASAALTVAVFHDPHTSQMQIGWYSVGGVPVTADALAAYYLATPGFKDAVDGMYNFRLKQQRPFTPEEGPRTR
jgi:hypothetical protein